MPFVHVSLRSGKSDAHRQAVFDGIYASLRETFNVPDDDQFMIATEHDAANFRYGASYLGIARSDDLVYIQITANDTRGLVQKKALYQAIAARLAANPGLRLEDVFINLVEVKKENWSFGNGVAQYV